MKKFLKGGRLMDCSLLTEYLAGSILTPPLAPPNGTSTVAHLNVMRLANAHTSSSVTSSLYLIPGDREGGRKGEREGGKGGREGGKEGEWEGEREREREGGRKEGGSRKSTRTYM